MNCKGSTLFEVGVKPLGVALCPTKVVISFLSYKNKL